MQGMETFMEKFFYPESIAIVGVSKSDDNLGRNIIENLDNFGYQGKIYAIGPKRGKVNGHTIYPSVLDLPDVPELAVVLTPARFVPEILKQCGEKGTRYAIIETAGFREMGNAGEKIEKELLAITRRFEIRFIGPNCVGIINTLNGFYVPFIALPSEYNRGYTSVVAQSGGIGFSISERLNHPGLGLSKFVSMGNKLNVDEVDYLRYLIRDPDTKVVYFYLEDFKRGRDFANIALKGNKPIILHKSNTAALSHTIASSHTAALAGDDSIVDAACEHANVVRVHSLEDAIRAIKGFSIPYLHGTNLAVLSRSGGHAVVAADACARYGFSLPELDSSILNEVKKHFRAGVIKLGNPLDLGDIYNLNVYSRIVEKTLQQTDIHGVLYIHVSQMMVEREHSIEVMKKLADLSAKYKKPIAVVLEVPELLRRTLDEKMTYPYFSEPGEAIEALALQYRYARCQEKKLPVAMEVIPSLNENVNAWFSTFEKNNRQPLLHESLTLLDRVGIRTAPWAWVTNLSEAEESAEKIGYPVSLKVVAPFLSHKSDQGGVVLNVENDEALRREWEKINLRFKDIRGVVIQKMIPASREMIIGAKRDPAFGPVVVVGTGGIMVEVIQDVTMRLAPVDEHEAIKMIDGLKCGRILGPFRGMKSANKDEIAQCVVKVSHLIHAFPRVQELDINPIMISDDGDGIVAVDARVVLKPRS